MSAEKPDGIARQYSFAKGPNYTDSILSLADDELAEADNLFHDGALKTIPGAARLTTQAISGATAVTGIYNYAQKDGTRYFVATTAGGRIVYQSGVSWTDIYTSLATTANTFWSWATFNNTMIAASGHNTVKKWDGTNFGTLAGTPPQSRFVTVHGDYVLLAGHTSNPSQIRYSDTDDATTWPIGNTLNIGLDDGQIITGMQRLGDVTVVFKDSSIYTLSGATPTDFTINGTISEVGCIAPNSIVLTDSGIFFWSEAGPALFNGFRTILLGRRLRDILADVDFNAPLKISAAYYPFRKQVLVSYQRTGQSTPDRALILDLYHVDETETGYTNFWPVLYGWTSTGPAEDSVGRKRVYFGRSTGFVLAWDSGTTFDTDTIISRARTKVYHLGHLGNSKALRSADLWLGSTSGNVVVRYAADGASSFTTHGSTPVSMLTSGNDLTFLRLMGDGSGNFVINRALQLEVLNATTGLAIHGLELGLEDVGRRGTGA